MHSKLLQVHCQGHTYFFHARKHSPTVSTRIKLKETSSLILKCRKQMASPSLSLLPSIPMNFEPISASYSPLDLTEENINLALADAKLEASLLSLSLSLLCLQLESLHNISICNSSLCSLDSFSILKLV